MIIKQNMIKNRSRSERISMKENADAARRSTVESLLRVVHTKYKYKDIYINIYKTVHEENGTPDIYSASEALGLQVFVNADRMSDSLIRLHSNC